jgi:hypothetical protein
MNIRFLREKVKVDISGRYMNRNANKKGRTQISARIEIIELTASLSPEP